MALERLFSMSGGFRTVVNEVACYDNVRVYRLKNDITMATYRCYHCKRPSADTDELMKHCIEDHPDKKSQYPLSGH